MSEKEKTGALRWLLHLHHGVSKGGEEYSPPSDAEWREAIELGKEVVGKDPDLVGLLQILRDYEMEAGKTRMEKYYLRGWRDAVRGIAENIERKWVRLTDEPPGWKWTEEGSK